MDREVVISLSNPLQRVKADRATVVARSVLAIIVVCGLLWGAFAQAVPLVSCTVPSSVGQGCTDAGGSLGTVEDTEVTDEAIFTCRGFALDPWSGSGDCPPENYSYRLLADLLSTDFLWGGDGYWHLVSDLDLPEGGEEEPPPETTTSWVPELAVEDAVKLWGAALMLLILGFVGAILRRAMTLR